MLTDNIEFGLNEEVVIKSILEEAFDCNLTHTVGKFNTFDYISGNKELYIEIKSRHNKVFDYQTTIIGYDKVIRSEDIVQLDKEVYFVFNFTDSIFHYKFCTVNTDWVHRNSITGKLDYYIPVSKLTEIYIK
jgi:hypothetical protein